MQTIFHNTFGFRKHRIYVWFLKCIDFENGWEVMFLFTFTFFCLWFLHAQHCSSFFVFGKRTYLTLFAIITVIPNFTVFVVTFIFVVVVVIRIHQLIHGSQHLQIGIQYFRNMVIGILTLFDVFGELEIEINGYGTFVLVLTFGQILVIVFDKDMMVIEIEKVGIFGFRNGIRTTGNTCVGNGIRRFCFFMHMAN